MFDKNGYRVQEHSEGKFFFRKPADDWNTSPKTSIKTFENSDFTSA